jgi:CheY-like chemotaxis protein
MKPPQKWSFDGIAAAIPPRIRGYEACTVLSGGGVNMSGEHILVVDDDEDFGAILLELLQTRGLRGKAVTSTRDALAALEVERPALVLLDWYLPDGPPLAVAEACRARAIPMVLSTAARETSDRAAEIGAVGALEKPFNLEALDRLLDRFVAPEHRV